MFKEVVLPRRHPETLCENLNFVFWDFLSGSDVRIFEDVVGRRSKSDFFFEAKVDSKRPKHSPEKRQMKCYLQNDNQGGKNNLYD